MAESHVSCYVPQDRQRTYNVTLRRVCETIIAVENKLIIRNECVGILAFFVRFIT
jgi:hypothetical protein